MNPVYVEEGSAEGGRSRCLTTARPVPPYLHSGALLPTHVLTIGVLSFAAGASGDFESDVLHSLAKAQNEEGEVVFLRNCCA